MATKWGVVSAGQISHDFVTAVRSLLKEDHEFVAVAARNLSSAVAFAKLHEISRSYGSYEELAKCPDVDVAYIGTIGATQFNAGKLMLEAGKHVLIETPMTLNVKQTKTLIEIARKNKLFLMQGLWSRFLPAYKSLMDILEKGTIGDVIHIHSNFGYPLVERYRNIGLPSGSILDLGLYNINAVTMVYGGEKPTMVKAIGCLTDDGVDISMSSCLMYDRNRSATMTVQGIADMDNDMVITGTKGVIRVQNPMWCPNTIETREKNYTFVYPETVLPRNYPNSTGLMYEAIEVRECIKKGLLESPTMPLKDTITMAEIMDEMRRQIGVVFAADAQ